MHVKTINNISQEDEIPLRILNLHHHGLDFWSYVLEFVRQ